ncbi:MAG: Ig-like domain-containing protein, partial [Planctomycetota bacterium]
MRQSQNHPMTEQLEPRQLFDMSYAPFMFNALNATDAPIADGTYVMALDLDGNGWQGNSYTAQSSGTDNASSWLWDANDMLMDRGQILNGEAYPFATISTAQKPATYTATVDHYYILWFDTPYSAGAAGPGAGVHYGAEDLGTVGTDPGDYNTFPAGGNASLTTVAALDSVPPTVALADPTDGATISDTTLNARGYIDVTFGDTGGSGLNVSTITDAGAEFTLGGVAASGVAVNGAATLVSGTTYRYTFTGAFTDGAVTVDFVA